MSKSVALDMNGHDIRCTAPITVFTSTSGITLDLFNSSETKSAIDGTYTCDEKVCQLAYFKNEKAELIVRENVEYIGGKGVEMYNGKLVLSGCSITASAPAVLVSGKTAGLTFAGATIDGGSSTLDGASASYTGSYVRN